METLVLSNDFPLISTSFLPFFGYKKFFLLLFLKNHIFHLFFLFFSELFVCLFFLNEFLFVPEKRLQEPREENQSFFGHIELYYPVEYRRTYSQTDSYPVCYNEKESIGRT